MEYADIDVALAVHTATLIDQYKDQISHFYLGSGDKDFHSIITKAQDYNIPVSLIISDVSSVSGELAALVNQKVDILY